MFKKGQVTIFIIIAILIIVMVFLFFIFKSSKNTQGDFFISDLQSNSITQSVYSCIELTAIDGIRLVGIQGGYISPPENSLNTNLSNIAYGYYKGKKTLPSLREIENEIGSYLELALPVCFDENMFEDLDIIPQNVDAEVKINSNSVLFLIDYPISISKDSSKSLLKEEYRIEVPIRLGEIHGKADEIIKKVGEDPSYIDLTYLNGLDYDITILPYEKDILIYSITDENSQIDDVPYTFMFANKLR